MSKHIYEIYEYEKASTFISKSKKSIQQTFLKFYVRTLSAQNKFERIFVENWTKLAFYVHIAFAPRKMRGDVFINQAA